MRYVLKSCIAFLFLLTTSVVQTTTVQAESIIDEIRLGAVWAQPELIDNGHPEQDQFAINGEVLLNPLSIDVFNRLDGSQTGFIASLLNPRPKFGVTGNLDSNGTSYVYTGLNWQFDLTELLFIEAGFGLGLTNGSTGGSVNRAALGSNVLFNETFAVGININERWTALIQIEHLSHAQLFDDLNRGLTNASVKVGYKF